VSDRVLAGAPAVAALRVIGNVPSGVLDKVEMLKLTDTGFALVGATAVEGWNLQAAPAGKLEQETDTEPLKLPVAESNNETDALVSPGVTLTLAGDAVPREKSTICKVSENAWVILVASVPTACKLKA
jgi:hypothetical protein